MSNYITSTLTVNTQGGVMSASLQGVYLIVFKPKLQPKPQPSLELRL